MLRTAIDLIAGGWDWLTEVWNDDHAPYALAWMALALLAVVGLIDILTR